METPRRVVRKPILVVTGVKQLSGPLGPLILLLVLVRVTGLSKGHGRVDYGGVVPLMLKIER